MTPGQKPIIISKADITAMKIFFAFIFLFPLAAADSCQLRLATLCGCEPRERFKAPGFHI